MSLNFEEFPISIGNMLRIQYYLGGEDIRWIDKYSKRQEWIQELFIKKYPELSKPLYKSVMNGLDKTDDTVVKFHDQIYKKIDKQIFDQIKKSFQDKYLGKTIVVYAIHKPNLLQEMYMYDIAGPAGILAYGLRDDRYRHEWNGLATFTYKKIFINGEGGKFPMYQISW